MPKEEKEKEAFRILFDQKTALEISSAEALILVKSSLATALAGVDILLTSRVSLADSKEILGAVIYIEMDRARTLLDDVQGMVLRRLKVVGSCEDDDEDLGDDFHGMCGLRVE